MDLRFASLSFCLAFHFFHCWSWRWSRSAGQSITQHQSRWKPKSSRWWLSSYFHFHTRFPPFSSFRRTSFFSLATLPESAAADATCKCNAFCHILVREIKCTQPATLCRNNKSPPLSRWISSQPRALRRLMHSKARPAFVVYSHHSSTLIPKSFLLQPRRISSSQLDYPHFSEKSSSLS